MNIVRLINILIVYRARANFLICILYILVLKGLEI